MSAGPTKTHIMTEINEIDPEKGQAFGLVRQLDPGTAKRFFVAIIIDKTYDKMVQQIDYQYAPIPKKLMYCLDRNCRSLLFALVDLADYFKSNKFYRSNEDLQKDTDLSKNLVIATLDTLYQNGLVDVDCVGKGVGRQTNIITLNTYKFKEWETYTFDEVRKLPELKINTVKYKGSGYKASYLNKNKVSCYTNLQEVPQSSSQQVLQKVNTIEETKETQYSKENNISKEIKNDLQKVNTCNDSKLPTCKIDIVEEEKSLKEFEKETVKEEPTAIKNTTPTVNIEDSQDDSVFFNEFLGNPINDYSDLFGDVTEFIKMNKTELNILNHKLTEYHHQEPSARYILNNLQYYYQEKINRQSQERTQQA